MMSRAWLKRWMSGMIVRTIAVALVSGALVWSTACAADTDSSLTPPAVSLDSLGRPEAPVSTTPSTKHDKVSTAIDEDVKRFNPDVFSLAVDGTPQYPGRSLFIEPASDVARNVLSATWFSSLVFLPFLILPQVLLFLIIYRFRDRGDGRKPATFLTNHRLELVWTAIPFLAVVIVSIPTYFILEFMEVPPVGSKDAEVVSVTGRQFAWDYEYKRYYKDPTADEKECLKIGVEPINQLQEPLILVKDRPVVLNLTSQDVNHAWWIPAFGVKKTAIKGRLNYVWFTPDILGVYKGQCAELCGANHGNMIITAVVVPAEEFAKYIVLLRHRDDTMKVWNALQHYQPPPAGSNVPPVQVVDKGAVDKAIAAYLAKDNGVLRQYALSYWIASNYASFERAVPIQGSTLASLLGVQAPAPSNDKLAHQIAEAISSRRAIVDEQLPGLAQALASMHADPALVAAAATPDSNRGPNPR